MSARNQAFADPGYDDAAPNPPPVRTTLHVVQNTRRAGVTPSKPNVLVEKFAEFDRLTFENKAAETAAARGIAAYLLRLEIERQYEPLRVEIEAMRKRVEENVTKQTMLRTDIVSRTAVMRDGSIIVGVLAVLAWLGTALSGTVLVHPLVSVLLIVGSVTFYVMSKVDT